MDIAVAPAGMGLKSEELRAVAIQGLKNVAARLNATLEAAMGLAKTRSPCHCMPPEPAA